MIQLYHLQNNQKSCHILCGGEGYDKIFGYSGDDIIFASVGDGDAIAGGDGIDICNVDPSATFRECEQIIFLVENIEITDEDTSVMITIATDKSSYKPGETIVISGNIDPIIENLVLTVEVIDANQNVLNTEDIRIVLADGTYTSNVVVDAGLFPTGIYTATAVSAESAKVTTDFTVQQIPITTIQLSDVLPKLGDQIIVTGTSIGVLDLLDSRILIDIISPSGESFTEVRERTFTSRISEIDNSYSEPMEIRTNFPFYEDSGEYVVEAFLVSNRDASTLPAVDVPITII